MGNNQKQQKSQIYKPTILNYISKKWTNIQGASG